MALQFCKHPSALRLFAVDFTLQLATGAASPETLSSSAAATVQGGDGALTVASAAINSAVITPPNNEQTIPIGQGVQFQCSAGTAGQSYTVRVSATSSAGNQLYMDAVVNVGTQY